MADTIGADAGNIPASFAKVAGYDTGGGSVPWSMTMWDRFPTSGHVHIDQSPGLTVYGDSHGAIVADVEPGAGTIANFVVQTMARHARGQWGHVYCSFDTAPLVVGALLAQKVDIARVDFWLANWNLSQSEASQMVGTYDLSIPGHGTVQIEVSAVQWASPSSNPHTLLPGSTLTLQQSNVDLSETRPDWFAYVPPKPPPVPTTETGIVVYENGGFKTVPVISHDSGKTWLQGS